MNHGLGKLLAIGVWITATAIVSAWSPADPAAVERPIASGLPLPGTMAVPDFEAKLFPFLKERQYVDMGWTKDKGVRDTGPYIDGTYYGTHPAVRAFYSPEVIRWLENGRIGRIPDGAMIVKEQYPPPAARHEGKTEEELRASLESWTVMVKDAAGSQDGWFWSNPAAEQCVVDNHQYPFDHPISGFGIYCVRCHAATRSPDADPTWRANEFTFASLRNVEGYPGEPLLFRIDDSWRTPAAEAAETAPAEETGDSHPRCTRLADPECDPVKPWPAFLDHFGAIDRQDVGNVEHLPPVTHDWVTAKREGQEFVTSNQCMSCHAGLLGPFGPTMFVPTTDEKGYGAPGRHVSPFGEWRWSPMGLAGRDPVFYAQLESEIALLEKQYATDGGTPDAMCRTLADTCLRCHGAMGKHQFAADHGTPFSLDAVHACANEDQPIGTEKAEYGALARDGISCMICHRMTPRPQPADDPRSDLRFYLDTSTTGNLHFGPPGEIYGPFQDKEISPYVMEHALGWKPKHSDYISSSRMCGSCHTVTLPVVEKPLHEGQTHGLTAAQSVPALRKFHHHVEQATYLEWLNSEYQDEFDADSPTAKSCQDCHMKKGVHDGELSLDAISSRIAAVQDTTYPDAENLADHNDLNVRMRDGYRRHNFSGLNVFLLTLFDQFDGVLGVRKNDFMTGSTTDLKDAIGGMVRMAEREVATVTVDATASDGGLTAKVRIDNKVGHRFPSGVGFRRAWIELLVTDAAGEVVWASGRTNELGVLVGPDGAPLPGESLADGNSADGPRVVQPHYRTITDPRQVQIYETLLCDAGGRMTTSFVRGCKRLKDNRLLPRGWRADGPDPSLDGEYLEATHPGPVAAEDPRYADGSGSDEIVYDVTLPAGVSAEGLTVKATLFYQALPPYYLENLFATAPDGPATRRLHYLCSHIDLTGTPIEGWKLPTATGTAVVR